MTLDIFPPMTSRNACFFMGERVGHKIKYGIKMLPNTIELL